MREQCVHIKDNGERCGVVGGLNSAGLCLWHDPERAEAAAEARRRGGQTSSRRWARTVDPEHAPPPPKTLEDALNWASWATHAVATGKIDARTAGEISRLLNSFRGTFEKARVQEEIDELRKQIHELRRASMKVAT